MSLDIEAFVAEPSAKVLSTIKRAELTRVAEHYRITIGSGAKKGLASIVDQASSRVVCIRNSWQFISISCYAIRLEVCTSYLPAIDEQRNSWARRL